MLMTLLYFVYSPRFRSGTMSLSLAHSGTLGNVTGQKRVGLTAERSMNFFSRSLEVPRDLSYLFSDL